MSTFTQYSIVRVVQFLHPIEDPVYNGWYINKRYPEIGDTGTIVEILRAQDLPDKYVVENVAPDATTIWLSDFDAEEIELVE